MNRTILNTRSPMELARAIGSVVSLFLLTIACGGELEPDGEAKLSKPLAPTVVGIPGEGQVTLTWETVEGAESYVVYFNDGDLDDKDVHLVEPAKSPQVIRELENDTAYSFAVAGKNKAGEGEWSKTVVVTPRALSAPLSAPGKVQATPADSQVLVSWSEVEGAEGYELFWSESTPIDRKTATRVAPVTSPHVVKALNNGTTYHFALIATNPLGESGLSDEVSATPAAAETAPQPPAMVVATAGDTWLSISWEAVASATSYDVFYTDAEELSEDTAIRLREVDSPLLIEDLINGKTYLLAVMALNSVGASELSEVVSATPAAADTAPQPPAMVVATAGDTWISISWEAVASATSYDVFYTDAQELSEDTAIRLGEADSPLLIEDLINGKTYLLAVRALNAVGASELSEVVSAVPVPQPPAKPFDISLLPGNASIVVSWTSPPDADAIDLFYGTQSPLSEDNATRIENVSSPYTLTGLTNGSTYYVRLLARHLGVGSGLSDELSTTPKAPEPPKPPTNVQATAGDGTLTVSWNSEPSASAHDLYFGTETPLNEANSSRVEDVASPYTLTGLMNGTRYHVALVSRNVYGASDFSDEADAMPLTVPDAPTGLSAVIGFEQVVLDWVPPASAESYTLYYRAGSEPELWNSVNIVGLVESQYTVTGLDNGTTYFFAVSASNAAGEGPMSSAVQATPADLRPVLTGVYPIEGPPEGGINVVLRGRSFEQGSAPRIWFGDAEASSITVDSDEQISLVLPQTLASGWAAVRIENDQGEAVRELGFAYSPYYGAARSEHELEVLSPGTVALGDFNEDGAVDYALIAGNLKRLEVVFGDGAGGVLNKKLITLSGSYGRILIAGDFDGDGHLDLAAGHQEFVQVHYGDGKGGFTSSAIVEPPGAQILNRLAAGDLDGDGRLELIASYQDHGASIFTSNANREWRHVMALPQQAGAQYGVVVGNFNQNEDDLLDIAVYAYSDGGRAQLSVYIQDYSEIVGDEPFAFRQGPELLMEQSISPRFVVRDFDGDGLDDIVVTANNVFFLKQRRDGAFDSTKYDMKNTEIRGVSAGDMDGDGLLDLVMVDIWDAELIIWYASEPGVFEAGVRQGIPSLATTGGVADFNGDGILDYLVVARPGPVYTGSWLLGDGRRRLAGERDGAHGYSSSSGLAIFIDEFFSNSETLAHIGTTGVNTTLSFFDLSEGGLTERLKKKAGTGVTQADTADFDGNGTADIVMNSSSKEQISIWRSLGDSDLVSNIPTPGVVSSLAAGDLNDDGHADLVLAIPSTNKTLIGLNDRNGGFTFESIPLTASHVALGDFDSDGDLDVVWAEAGELGFIWNDEQSFIPEGPTLELGLSIRRVRTADVDGDGLIDLLVLAAGQNSRAPDRLFVYRNNGDNTWTTGEYEVGYEAADCTVGDGNGDGIIDLFVSNQKSGTVSFLQGDGTGNFLPQVRVDAGGTPYGLIAYDQGSTLFVGANHIHGSITAVKTR